MVSFSILDLSIIIVFFAVVLLIGFLPGMQDKSGEGFLLSGRKVGLFLFILTNVSTWYGGILGVGEFTYRYGLLSWFTQGLPYYIFAIIFALLFAKKIRSASLFTIPDKLEEIYGRQAGVISSVLVFILVSPAPYLLMVGSLLSLIFNIPLLPSLVVAVLVSVSYLFRSGYKSYLYTDAFQFFVMFIGFFVIVYAAYTNLGGVDYLVHNLPADHLKLTGGASPAYIIVWFLIALWTFADPGFHQRCYAAKTGKIAATGIIISVFFWALFDFLTTSTGLFARASIPNMSNPVLAFPLFAEKILGSGYKGIFYAALFATIISTLNSFMFLSATTFGRDFIYKLKRSNDDTLLAKYTRWGLLVSSIVSIILAFSIDSVIEIWYSIGSICIPGIILPIFGAYFEKFRISSKLIVIEICAGVLSSLLWLVMRPYIGTSGILSEIEPMIAGLIISLVIHIYGLLTKQKPNVSV